MSKVLRITSPISLRELEERIRNYEPTQKDLADIERAFRLGPPKEPKKKNTSNER